MSGFQVHRATSVVLHGKSQAAGGRNHVVNGCSACGVENPVEAFFSRESQCWEKRYESRTYRERRALIRDIVGAEALRLQREPRSIKVLDFGCGTGLLLGELAALGLQVTGVDSSKAMIDSARARLTGSTLIELEWAQNGSWNGTYESRIYDLVLCVSVLEFVPDVESLLAHLCRLVAPGGLLIVSVPNRRSWLRAIEGFIHQHPSAFRAFAALDHITTSDSYLNHQIHQWHRSDLLEMLRREGLREEEHRFHVAPLLICFVAQFEAIGMMLLATFRKPPSAPVPT